VRKGKKKEALDRINRYYNEQQSVNSVVGSSQVADNLDKDVEALRGVVKETFIGTPAAVEQKQKKNAKALQYEGYVGRRINK
jgi:Ca-activated chloride channel family protein